MNRIRTLLIWIMVPALPGMFLLPTQSREPTKRPAQGPNLLLDASAALVNAAVQRPVDRMEPVQEVVQETPVDSMTRMQGTVWAELIPDPCRAAVDVVLNGRVCSWDVGIRPRALIYTFTTTSLEVRRRILIDGEGIHTYPGPPCARSTISLLEVTSRNGERDTTATDFARLGFKRNQVDAEAETAGKSAWRASNRLQEDLSGPLASASQSVGRGLKEIKRAGLSLDFLQFNTSSAFLQARLRIATPRLEPEAKARALPADTDFGMRIHQSLVNEAAQATLGGKTFPVTEVKKFYDEAARGLLLDGRKDADRKDGLRNLEKLLAALPGKPAMITLAKKNPLTVVVADQGFTTEIQVASIRHGGVLYMGMRARAAYRLENSKEGAQAVRQGPVRFFPPEAPSPADKKLEAQPASFLLIRDLVFAEILKERVMPIPLRMPDSLPSPRFLPPRADAGNGWLTLTWKLAPRLDKS